MATQYLAPADGDGEPELKKQFPHIFGFLAGAFGKHPDELSGSDQYERLMEQEDKLMELLRGRGITAMRARVNPEEAFQQASDLQKARR